MRAVRELLLTSLTTATVLIAIWSWSLITSGLGHAMPTIVLTGVVVALIGMTARIAMGPTWMTAGWSSPPRLIALVLQLAAAWAVVSIRIARTPIPLRYVPRMRLEDAFVAAGNAIAHGVPPVPVIGGVLPLVLCGAGLALVLADLLARTLRLTAVAGLVLLTVLAVPISVMGSDAGVSGAARRGVEPWIFALVVLGWLTQLVLAEDDRLGRWGRVADESDRLRSKPDRSNPQLRSWAATAAVGGAAIVLALVVPLAIPATRADFSGFGSGGGAGNGKVTVTNPMIDVRQNLVQGADIPLVTVRTTDPQPGYLRIAVLTRFASTQWTAGDRIIPNDQSSHGNVPISGSPSLGGAAQYPYQIQIAKTFVSHWLPTPYPINRIDADGDWRYDTRTDDFIAHGTDLTTAGLSYTATKVQPPLTAAALSNLSTGAGQVASMYTDVPSDLPPIVAETARQVTHGATTPFEQAVALQTWFRNTGGFTYSTSVGLGSGGADLAFFLGDQPGSRTGYCQQFSAAMAAMARTLGIPARVAVGFLNPSKQPDGSYVFSSHDMHAWPELYFSGAGWVRFEPTPAAAGTSVPAYAHKPGTPVEPTTGPSASASASPTVRPTSQPSVRPDKEPTNQQTSQQTEHHLGRWLVGVLVLGLLACLVAAPGAIRRGRRRARLGEGVDPIRAADAWAELRDTAIDLGVPWTDGLSPRETRTQVDGYVAGQAGRDALDLLVDAVERERYAASSAPLDPRVVRTVIAGLEQGEPPTSARRAAWWPRSVLTRRPAAAESTVGLDRVG